MAYIIKRKVKKHIYYYLAVSARVNDKPRIVSKKYLGKAENIAAAYTNDVGEIKAEHSTVYDLGAVLALFDVAERLGIREIIDRHANKRNQGLPVSASILLAAINRAVMPKSKNSFYDWYAHTVLNKCFPEADKENLSSQGFWNNMEQLDQAAIRLIEDDITKKVVNKYKVRTDCLLFDNTNFYTYMDTDNPSILSKHGHSKEKRSDLKIIGLSLMTSSDHSIPLFHETYPGNTNDAKRFADVLPCLKDRYKKLGRGDCDVTLVFDRGNNDDDNIRDILRDVPIKFHFVGGLRLNQCGELRTIPLSDLAPLEEEALKETTAYRTTKNVYGRDFTVVMTYNPELFKTQLRGVSNNIIKCEAKLLLLKESLLKWVNGIVCKGRKPSKSGVLKRVSSILSAEHMKEVFNHSTGTQNGCITLEYSLNSDKLELLKQNTLGRSFLFTDRSDWSNEKIVGAYRSQYHVEEAFKRMKDTKFLSFRPIFHFTDSKIRVHAFYCVLAYLLTSLINLEFEDMGIKISIPKMLDCLQNVCQVITVVHKVNSHKDETLSTLSGLEGVAKIYIKKYRLLRYINLGTT
jgi:transposase